MSNGRLLQELAVKLKQPQWIAVILSLGFHGALFAAGPSFSSLNMNALGGDLPEAERRQVPVIELSPEEQSRLPDFSSFPYDLSAQEDEPFSLFPPSGSSLPLSSTPESPLNSPSSSPTPKPSGSGTFGLVPPYTPPQRPSISFLPRRSPLSSLPRRPSITTNLPVPPAETTPTPEEPTEGSMPTMVEADPPSGPTASDLAVANPDAQEEGAMSTPLEGSDGASSAPANPLQAQIAALAYRPENTTEEEAEDNLEAWQANLEERLPGELETASDPIEMQLSYVQRLCLEPEPKDALLGLLALPTEESGELELFPQVLKSTGYPFLDQEAIVALNDLKTPPETEAEEAPLALEPAVMYQVQVNVEYDQETCIDRESLLEEIKANQESSTSPATPSTPSRSESPTAPEASDPPNPDSTPEQTEEPTPEPQEQPEPTEAPGAEALQ